LWPSVGGIVIRWFHSDELGLYVRLKKLDLASWLQQQYVTLVVPVVPALEHFMTAPVF
jgi:hypothetical protein